MLYVGIAVLVIGIAFAIGTYAYYSTTITGNATGTTLAYTCTGNNETNFTLAPFTNAYPGYSATRTISLNASIYTEATINVSSYTNMGAGSIHPNLLIYSDENHTKAMSDGVNTITTTITPSSSTSVPLYIYWPYGNSAETYDASVPSATITITCNQGVDPSEVAAAKLASGKTCVAVANANDLHTETCANGSSYNAYCYADGYYSGGSKNTTTITYGSIWDGTETIPTGAAFDCDVNNNGVIDKVNGVSTERFYYVSDYYNTGSQTFDTTTGVLIYYKNYQNGTPSDDGAAYDSSGDNWHGPVTAVNHLPVVSGANAWRSDLLKTNTRAILAENGTTHNATATSGGTLPTAFEYKNSSNVANAARLLTVQELMRGCNLTQVGNPTARELSTCNFLFEGTKYANSSKATTGPWLETPVASNSDYAWIALGYYRYVSDSEVYSTSRGVRPTIEVAKSKLG